MIAGEAARVLKENGVSYECMLVDNEYGCDGEKVKHLDDVLGSAHEKVNVIVAFNYFDNSKLDRFSNVINKVYYFETGLGNNTIDGEYMTFNWVTSHSNELQTFYNELSDEISRRTLLAFLNQRISRLSGFVAMVKSANNQYFEPDIIKLTDDEVFVDCGAYTGDTASIFINELKKRGIDLPTKIVCFEPDEKNFRKLVERKIPNAVCLKKGTSDKAETVHFSQKGTSASMVSDDGDIVIETDTIDNVLDGKKATLIKMDIEGAELSTLKGAAKTIKKYKPSLAICIYHKKADLYEIPQYIHRLVAEYRFYVRIYSHNSHELVLYAIPQK